MPQYYKRIPRWGRILLLAAAVIAIYKGFDSLPTLFHWLLAFLSLFTPVFIGLIFAFFFHRPALYLEHWLQKCPNRLIRNGSRFESLIILYLLFLGGTGAVVWAVFPVLLSSISDFLQEIPHYFTLLKEKALEWEASGGFLSQTGLVRWVQGLSLDTFIPSSFQWDDPKFLQTCFDSVINLSGIIGNLFIGIIFSFYMLLEKETLLLFVQRILRSLIKEPAFCKLRFYFHKSSHLVFRYFGGQFLDSLAVGLCSALFLILLKVPYGFVLGLLFGLFNLVPYFGPLFMGGAAILIILVSTNLTTAIWAGIFLIIVQQLDANILNPKILGSVLQISPFWILFAVTAGGIAWGIWGMLTGVPIFAILRMLLLDFLDAKEAAEKPPKTDQHNEPG